ncbi:MAG TPA: hypothetical protein VK133_02105 [Amoebophilaceae bacterium]|jgi:transcriptional regulator with XRE-family HTH domain|nr:hypothetical protein [Amoebophilaceae bacterium]
MLNLSAYLFRLLRYRLPIILHTFIEPTIEIAFKIAQALLDVSLDFLMGNTSIIPTDKRILSRLENITALPRNKQEELFNVIDTYLRDFNTSKAYKE